MAEKSTPCRISVSPGTLGAGIRAQKKLGHTLVETILGGLRFGAGPLFNGDLK